MPFYSVLVKGKEKGFRFPRRIAIEAADKHQAHLLAKEKCADTPYQPDYNSMTLITRGRYNRIMGLLLGKKR